MEDEVLRELERTVPVTLLIGGWMSEEPAAFIEAAESMLVARTEMLNMIINDVNIDFDHQDGGIDTDAAVILDDAICEIKVRRAHHGKVLSVINRCIMYNRRHADEDEMRRSWVWYHLAADKCAEKAMETLRQAATLTRISQDAFDIAQTFQERTLPWVTWMRRAEKFEDAAAGKALDGWGEMIEMRQYVRMEFRHAWKILYS